MVAAESIDLTKRFGLRLRGRIISWASGRCNPCQQPAARGFVTTDGRVVPEITPGTFEAVRSHIHGSEGTDVTGGMLGKVRELLGIDIDSYIFSAVKPGMIAGFLSGEEPGTRITNTGDRPVVDMPETSPIPTDSGRD